MQVSDAITAVVLEFKEASLEFPPIRSVYEGHKLVMQAYAQFDAEVFREPCFAHPEAMCKEAKQLAALAIRFMVECT